MAAGEGKIEPGSAIELTDAQRKARRSRNIAIGFGLFALVAVFYAATIVKFGPRLMDRPIININTN